MPGIATAMSCLMLAVACATPASVGVRDGTKLAIAMQWPVFCAVDERPTCAAPPVELEFDLPPVSDIIRAGHRLPLTLSFADPQKRDAPPPVVILAGDETPSALTPPLIPVTP